MEHEIKKILVGIFLLFLPVSDIHAQSNYTVQLGQHAYTSLLASRQYLLFLPKTYGQDPYKKWPLIVFLHGSGVPRANVENIKIEAFPQMLEYTPNFPSVVVSPLLGGAGAEEYWTLDVPAHSVEILLDEIALHYAIDTNREYLTGYSLGAGGTWGLGLRFFTRFAALVPVAGFYGTQSNHNTPANICDLKHTPVWAFHGALDTTITIALEQDLVNKLRECGGNVQFTIYPQAGHDISAPAYINNPALYTWLFAQSRPNTIGSKPGDANGDTMVDGRDYVIWLTHYGQNVLGVTNGDFDTNSIVDGRDYVIWLNNYGK